MCSIAADLAPAPIAEKEVDAQDVSRSIEDRTLEVDFDEAATNLYQRIGDQDWDAALLAIKDDITEARTWVARNTRPGGGGRILWRFLPLHLACAAQPPVDVILALLNAFPEATAMADNDGM